MRLWVILVLIPCSLAAQGYFERLKSFKDGESLAVANGAPYVSDGIYLRSGKALEREITEKIQGGREIFLSAVMLANQEVLKSLSVASKKGAFVAAILENKIDVKHYPVPDYLAANSIPVFYPVRSVRMANNLLIVDREIAYVLQNWNFKDSEWSSAIRLNGKEHIRSVLGDFSAMFEHCESSDATRMDDPDAYGQVVGRLK